MERRIKVSVIAKDTANRGKQAFSAMVLRCMPTETRKKQGRQITYANWSSEEMKILTAYKGVYGGYRRAARELGRSYQSCKDKGGRL